MTPKLPHRYRFYAQTGLVSEAGQYKANIDWVIKSNYTASNGPVFQRAIARWVSSISAVDVIRFDGDGAGELSHGVMEYLSWDTGRTVVCSEFSKKLQLSLMAKGHCDMIIDDGLIPPGDGGTVVIIANQFLDALPFTVMRKLYPSGTVQEMSINHDGSVYYETLNNCKIDENAASDIDRMSGLFAYSPAKANYVRHMLSRVGKTFLAIIDWAGTKDEHQYLNDVLGGGLVHSTTSPSMLRRLALQNDASVVFSDKIKQWGYMDTQARMLNDQLYENLHLTIIACDKTAKLRHLTCAIAGD